MYAEHIEKTNHFNLMDLTEVELVVIEFGLCSIHMNTPEHFLSQKLSLEIDNELNSIEKGGDK